jgi:hypothetical protein
MHVVIFQVGTWTIYYIEPHIITLLPNCEIDNSKDRRAILKRAGDYLINQN